MARRREPLTPLPTCDQLWTPTEVAAYLGVPVTTLYQWRTGRIGPDAFRVGRHLRYDPDVVKRWLVEQCFHDRSA